MFYRREEHIADIILELQGMTGFKEEDIRPAQTAEEIEKYSLYMNTHREGDERYFEIVADFDTECDANLAFDAIKRALILAHSKGSISKCQTTSVTSSPSPSTPTKRPQTST